MSKTEKTRKYIGARQARPEDLHPFYEEWLRMESLPKDSRRMVVPPNDEYNYSVEQKDLLDKCLPKEDDSIVDLPKGKWNGRTVI